jgi:hypothetical protein
MIVWTKTSDNRTVTHINGHAQITRSYSAIFLLFDDAKPNPEGSFEFMDGSHRCYALRTLHPRGESVVLELGTGHLRAGEQPVPDQGPHLLAEKKESDVVSLKIRRDKLKATWNLTLHAMAGYESGENDGSAGVRVKRTSRNNIRLDLTSS